MFLSAAAIALSLLASPGAQALGTFSEEKVICEAAVPPPAARELNKRYIHQLYVETCVLKAVRAAAKTNPEAPCMGQGLHRTPGQCVYDYSLSQIQTMAGLVHLVGAAALVEVRDAKPAGRNEKLISKLNSHLNRLVMLTKISWKDKLPYREGRPTSFGEGLFFDTVLKKDKEIWAKFYEGADVAMEAQLKPLEEKEAGGPDFVQIAPVLAQIRSTYPELRRRAASGPDLSALAPATGLAAAPTDAPLAAVTTVTPVGADAAPTPARPASATYHFEDLKLIDQELVKERYRILVEAQAKHDYRAMLNAAAAINQLVDEYKDSRSYHKMAIRGLESMGQKVEPAQLLLPERSPLKITFTNPEPRTFTELSPARQKFIQEQYALLLKASVANDYQAMNDHARSILIYVDTYEDTKILATVAQTKIDAEQRARAAAQKK